MEVCRCSAELLRSEEVHSHATTSALALQAVARRQKFQWTQIQDQVRDLSLQREMVYLSLSVCSLLFCTFVKPFHASCWFVAPLCIASSWCDKSYKLKTRMMQDWNLTLCCDFNTLIIEIWNNIPQCFHVCSDYKLVSLYKTNTHKHTKCDLWI